MFSPPAWSGRSSRAQPMSSSRGYCPFFGSRNIGSSLIPKIFPERRSTTFTLQLNLCKRFYPERPSGQVVVTDHTGGFPSPPRYMPSFLSRVGFSIPTFQPFFYARRFSSNFANSWTLSRFPLVNAVLGLNMTFGGRANCSELVWDQKTQ